MQKDQKYDAGRSGLPESLLDHDASSGGFQPSAKLRDKLEKLAKWRINQSSVEFLEDAPKFRGGNATVVKGFLASPSGDEDQNDQSNVTQGKSLDPNGPEGEASQQPKVVAVKKMNISDDRAKVLGLTLREAEFLVDLSHENVIELEGFVEDLSKNIVWLVFPWEDNGTLRDFIASVDWEIPERISLINDVARGVQYLHSRTSPIRHGDLKSSALGGFPGLASYPPDSQAKAGLRVRTWTNPFSRPWAIHDNSPGHPFTTRIRTKDIEF